MTKRPTVSLLIGIRVAYAYDVALKKINKNTEAGGILMVVFSFSAAPPGQCEEVLTAVSIDYLMLARQSGGTRNTSFRYSLTVDTEVPPSELVAPHNGSHRRPNLFTTPDNVLEACRVLISHDS